MSYLALRHLHITCVVVSVTLFVLRGGLGLWGVDWRRRWPVLRWLPHANDSVLMAAGVGLMVWSAQYPGAQHPWLAAKLGLLNLGAVTPEFVGLSREQAQLLADKRHIALLFEEVDDARPVGTVVNQHPAPGTRLTEKVQLQVSTGLATVPVLAGLSLEEAAERLRSVGLSVVRVDSQYSDIYPAGQVVSVGPKSGSRIRPEAAVTLTVAAGRATCPECGAKREPKAEFCIRCGHKY